MGSILVPGDRYWGAQTQRALEHFAVGADPMPVEIVHAMGAIKRAAALVNHRLGVVTDAEMEVIVAAATEVADGALDDHFPLGVYQSGSGTQTNMNVNEVVANRAIHLMGGTVGSRAPVHPNDHVNASQSSNDTFPTAVHLAVALAVRDRLRPALVALDAALRAKADELGGVVKIGRTHLQDAVPLMVGDEWSGYAAQVEAGIAAVDAATPALLDLAIGGTAVGTGLSAPAGFGDLMVAELAAATGLALRRAPNPFAALAGADALTAASGAFRQVASSLFKVANDLRWLGSGPRAGLGELRLPANEPGSSIMPGKVNPSQAEALMMRCVTVLGNDVAVGIGASQGNFELNVMRPMLAATVLRSADLLAAGADGFRRYMVEGVELDEARVAELVGRSLMLVTALSGAIGYDRAAAIAHRAHAEDLTLRDAAIASGDVTAEEFDRLVDPVRMADPQGGWAARSRSGAAPDVGRGPAGPTPHGSTEPGG